MQDKITELENRIAQLENLNEDNFSGTQIFIKKCKFTTHLQVPNYASTPTGGGFTIGEIIEVGGKLKICTAATATSCTFTIVGTQS